MNRHVLSIIALIGLVAAAGPTAALAQGSVADAPVNGTTGQAETVPPAAETGSPLSNPVSRRLEKAGVNFRGSEIDQFARNPIGGIHQGDTNVGQFNAGIDLDLKTIMGVNGGSFHAVMYRDYGYGLGQTKTGTFTKQQFIYKNPYPQWHLGLFAYQQKLLEDKLDIQIGRLGGTTYYGHLTANCLLLSGNLCGEPRQLVAESGLSLLPSATWGINTRYRPTPHTYMEFGIFEVNPTIQPSHGFDFSMAHDTGLTAPAELGWGNTDPDKTRYPFELKLGSYVSTAALSDPYFNTKGESRGLYGGTARIDNNDRDGIYIMGDRTLWRPDSRRTESLSIFGGAVQQLEDAEIMRQQIYTGLVWTSPFFLDRKDDTLSFSVSEMELTPGERDFLRDARIKAGGSGINNSRQYDWELAYNWHVWHGIEVLSSVQYLQHPDNSGITNTAIFPKNILAYGVGIRMDLGYLAGFRKGVASD